jgi:hypothetical protein
MVAGDVVNGVAAAGVTINFTPAAGVECLISYVSGSSTNGYGLNDGVNTSDPVVSTSRINDMSNMKLFITNTVWFFASPDAGPRGYSGVQIK